ncbi:MAG: phosphoribosylamine--glycine ligase [Elusimicrobia bacterium]|nr:phosphoribosylamine--glycine ligase [Elusimicrobiota bacterium]
MSREPDLTVLLLGSGGREHALAWAMAQSPRLKNLYALPGSDAIAQWAQNLPGDPCDPDSAVQAAKDCRAKLVVIGPEAPLAAGVSDALRQAGLAVFGPSRAAARLESSKAFAKEFMRKHGIPTAPFEVFTEPDLARAAIKRLDAPIVVKADGLAAGKGVAVCRDQNEALSAIDDFMEKGSLGAAGRTILLETRLHGPELSVLAFCDGQSLRALPPSRDHKRLKDHDEGPNTGGMGAYCPAAVDPETWRAIEDKVLRRFIAGLSADKLDFRGVIFVGLMLSPEGPQVLEFNCRFGDPETQAILPLLEEDPLALAWDCAAGRLKPGTARARSGASICVVLASEGYPAKPRTGVPIHGLESARDQPGLAVFHAGTSRQGDRWLTQGGRVLGVTAVAPDLAQARDRAYEAVSRIRFDGMQYRKDIGGKVPALR